jgi:hypothetical protein
MTDTMTADAKAAGNRKNIDSAVGMMRFGIQKYRPPRATSTRGCSKRVRRRRSR